MKQTTHSKGKIGEIITENYLKQNKYLILAKNIYIGHLEIDLIAQKNGQIIFIEVKTSFSPYGTPEDWLTPKKIYNLARAALLYCRAHQIEESLINLDFIAIFYSKSKKIANIKHFMSIL